MEHDIDIDIDRASPTLDEVLDDAKVSVTRFPPAQSYVYEDELEKARLPKGSLLGTLLRKSDGMVLDRGWIRILGLTSQACGRTLAGWNDPLGWRREWGGMAEAMLVFADDPAGNQFGINLGMDGQGNWQVYRGCPVERTWTSLERTFGQWFHAVLADEHGAWYPEEDWARFQVLLEEQRATAAECWAAEPPLSQGGSWTTSAVRCVPASQVTTMAAGSSGAEPASGAAEEEAGAEANEDEPCPAAETAAGIEAASAAVSEALAEAVEGEPPAPEAPDEGEAAGGEGPRPEPAS